MMKQVECKETALLSAVETYVSYQLELVLQTRVPFLGTLEKLLKAPVCLSHVCILPASSPSALNNCVPTTQILNVAL